MRRDDVWDELVAESTDEKLIPRLPLDPTVVQVVEVTDGSSVGDGGRAKIVVLSKTKKGKMPALPPGIEQTIEPGISNERTSATRKESIEWSYMNERKVGIDPNFPLTQLSHFARMAGPFVATVMQGWYDAGVLPHDTQVKRTHLTFNGRP